MSTPDKTVTSRIEDERKLLAAIVERVRPHLPLLAARSADDYARRFEEYGRLSTEAHESVIESAFSNLRALMREIQFQTKDPAFDTVRWERVGATRMRQGISIESLMRSYTIWGQNAWKLFLDNIDRSDPKEMEALLYINERIFWHVEHATGSMATGYMREARSTWSDRELTRFSMLDALVTGRFDPTELGRIEQARDLANTYVVIATVPRVDSSAPPALPEDHLRRLSRLAAMVRPHNQAMPGIRDRHVFLLWPVDDELGAATLGRIAEEITRELSEMAVGVGGRHPGLPGVRISFEEAVEAAGIAAALGSTSPLEYTDLRLERLAVSSELVQDMSREALGPVLEYDRKRAAQLIDTLRAYVDAGGNIADAAAAMFVHPNTVIYRLRRIADISGLDPRNPRGLLVLSLSLLAHRISVAQSPP